MDQKVIKSLYDELFLEFHEGCRVCNHMDFPIDCDVLVIAVGMKGQIESLLRFMNAQETKPGRIYMLVQKNMIPVLEDLVNPQIILLPWQGPYNETCVPYLKEKVDVERLGALFYQGRQPLDYQDTNLWDILETLQKEKKEPGILAMQDITDHVVEYKNSTRLRAGMELYRCMNQYLET